MKKLSFLSVISEVNSQFGIEAKDPDQIIDWALAGYAKIGNADVQLKLIKACPKPDGQGHFVVELPCDVYEIEAVCLPFTTGKEVSATDDFLAGKTYDIENWIEAFKRNKSNFYLPGAFVKHTQIGNKLYFMEPHPQLDILYKEQLLDPETELPMLSQDELDALAVYCAYSYDLRRGRRNKDQATLNIAQMEYQMWQKACAKARVRYLNQNEINEVLDVISSWGGSHSHGVTSTKPIP